KSKNAIQGLGPLREIAEHGIGEAIPVGGAVLADERLRHDDETVRIAHGQAAHHECIEDAEDRGIRSDSERKRQDHGCCKAAVAYAHSGAVARLPRQVVSPADDPSLATLLAALLDPAELKRRPPPCFRWSQTGADQVFDTAVQVIAQLALQVVLHPVASAPEQVEEPAHGLLPLIEDQ